MTKRVVRVDYIVDSGDLDIEDSDEAAMDVIEDVLTRSDGIPGQITSVEVLAEPNALEKLLTGRDLSDLDAALADVPREEWEPVMERILDHMEDTIRTTAKLMVAAKQQEDSRPWSHDGEVVPDQAAVQIEEPTYHTLACQKQWESGKCICMTVSTDAYMTPEDYAKLKDDPDA